MELDLPAGMTSTVGLELTNFLNPDLTWKKVSKGHRSATRHNRKPVAKIATDGVELADKSARRAEDATVSDSEKLGVAVLGRHFSDKMEHVPIKKRKYNFRSPSPPPRTPSPHNNVTQHGSCQGSSPNSSGKGVHMAVDTSISSIISPHGVDGKVLEAMNVKLDFREDFSGIEMLADAVCSDSFDVNVDHTVENPVSESACRENESAMLKEETGVSLETINISPKDTSVEDIVEKSSFQDNTTHFDEQTSPSLEDNKVEGSVSLCNDRLHWDLNVVMDDWQTLNVQTNNLEDSSVDKSEKLNIIRSGEMDRESGETDVVNNDDMVNNLVSSEVHGMTDLHSDSRGSSFGSNKQDNQLDACSGLDHNHDECGADGKPSAQVVRIEKCLSNVPCPSNMASSTSPFLEEKTKTGVIEDKIAFVENVQVEEHDVASPFVPVVDGVTHEVNGTVPKMDGEDSSSLHNDTSAPQKVSSIENCLRTVSLRLEPVCEVEKVGVSYVSLRCEDVSTSSAPVEEVKPIIAEEKNPLPEETFPSHTSVIDSSVHAGSEEVIPVSSGYLTATVEPVSGFTTHEDCIDYALPKGLGEINNENPNNRICESDPSQNDKGHIIGTENSWELQAGYDSQFEDGELRETDVPFWDENEGDTAEIEQVDYESECDGERLCVSEAECSENKMKFESGSTQGSGDVTEKIEECTVGAAAASGDHLTSSKIRTLEATDGSKLNKDTVDCEGGANRKDFGSEVVGSRECKRGLLSLTEGSLSSDTIQRSGSNNCDDIFPRPERELGSKSMEKDRSDVQIHCRNPGGGDGHIVNSHQSATYDTLYGSGRPRPRSIIESCGSVMASDPTISEATGVEAAFENRVCRQYLSSSSNSVYLPLNRRSLAFRDDINGIHGGAGPVRGGNNPDRSRFRRHPQGFSREIREDCHRPMSNYSTDHMTHRFARRERSISLVGGGRLNYAQPYEKSQSRSRSRSPTSGLLLREQNGGSRNEGSRRHSSNSPNFRSVRMDRVGFPFQKRFAADFEEVRFSPQHNTQFDDRIPAPDNFRSPNFRSVRMERVRLPCKKHFAADYEDGFISPPRKRFSPQLHSQFDERLDNFRSVRTDRARLPFQKHFAADDEGYISPPRKCFSPQHHTQFDDRISAQDNFRSPNFRSDRMERARLPFQKHFAADDEEGFISPPRKRLSPQHNSQFDDRISDPDNFRSSNLRSVRMNRARLPFQKHFAADYEGGFISPPRKRFLPQHHSQFDERIPALDNFRSVRTDRLRLPFQKHFAADDEEGYISPPRKCFSPQNNSRFDESIDNLRDRKSPVGNFRQGQMFESVRSSRPIGHPRRFPDMDGAGRGYKYEGGGGDDDRRKQGSRFDMIPRVRRLDDSNGVVGQHMTTAEDE